MSKYTTEVRFICENAAGYDESKGFNDVEDIIDAAIPVIFNFTFPIFDESYRNVLCTKILMHYYTKEIGLESVGLWKLKLRTKLNEIMPFYNQLYESELIKFNPLYDVDLKTTHVGNKDSENISSKTENENSSSTGTNFSTENKSANSVSDEKRSAENNENENADSYGNATSRERGETDGNKVDAKNYSETKGNTHYDIYSETPQGALTGVEDEEYLTNARKITDSEAKSGKDDSSSITKENYDKNNSNEKTEIANRNANSNYSEENNSTHFNNEENERKSVNIDDRSNERSSSGSDKFKSAESYILHVCGKQAGASYSKLLKEFRETFLNIDLEVINSLSDLFMNIW